MREIEVSPRSLDSFVDLLGGERVESIERLAKSIRAALGSAAVWNVNSTAKGGGVAEMLLSLLRYARGLGVDARWAVLEGPPEFFRITKRLHNALHDDPGDGLPLGSEQVAIFDRVTEENFAELAKLLRRGDIVVCHDPQTAGLVPHLVRAGMHVVWRCHIGHDRPGPHVDEGWEFLRPYLEHVPMAVFSRAAYAPAWLPRKRFVVLPPNIDPFSVKNQRMEEEQLHAILSEAGLVRESSVGSPTFLRTDGSIGRVTHRAEVVEVNGLPRWETPLVVQVSRWDRMKDPVGVLEAFARLAERVNPLGAHLVLAGPTVRGVPDDPEAPEVFRELERAWNGLPEEVRKTVHLAQLPMDDNDENAAIVNALQQHAAIILQKSLREGFGLTVTEAMWKRRPIVASAIGGIPDQIRDGIDGLLIHDPTDLDEVARHLGRILEDKELAHRLGESARARAREEYLSSVSLERWAEIVRSAAAA